MTNTVSHVSYSIGRTWECDECGYREHLHHGDPPLACPYCGGPIYSYSDESE